MRSLFVALGPFALALLALGCSCGEDGLRGEGERSFVRCAAGSPPEARAWTVGGLRLVVEERRLRIEGAPSPLRLVVFAGGGGAPMPLGPIRALRPHVVAVLGDLGPPEEALGALAELDVPILVLAGGADEHAPLERAFGALEEPASERVVNASALRAISIGPLELVPVAGAPGGRYARTDGACGLSEDDVGLFDLDGPEEGVHRVLLSWAGPEGSGPGSVTAGLLGVEAGSPLVRRVAEEAGAEGALFAWPTEHAGETPDGAPSWTLRFGVPPGAGAAVVRADGSRSRAGPTLVLVGPQGLTVQPRSP